MRIVKASGHRKLVSVAVLFSPSYLQQYLRPMRLPGMYPLTDYMKKQNPAGMKPVRRMGGLSL